MDGENDEGQQLPQKENLRESFTIAANALTSLYKKSIRLEQEGRMIGGRDAISGMYEWILKRGTQSGTIPTEELLEICRAMYLSFGGGTGELREDFPAIKAPEKTSAGSFRNEGRQMSVESAKGQKDTIGKDSASKLSKCHNCGTPAGANLNMIGRKRHRYATDHDIEGDSELSQLFLSKIGSPWAPREKNWLLINHDKDEEEDNGKDDDSDTQEKWNADD